jgi:hypothetical protein
MGDGGHTVAQVHRALAKEIAMARKRASLKGKGQAILLGEEMAEESPTVSASETETPSEVGKEAPSEALTAEEGEEVDWSGMLEDEVATAEPPAEGEAPRPLPAIEYYYPEEESAEPKAGLPTIAQPSPAPVSPVAPATPVPAEPQLASPPSAEAEAFPPEVDAHGVDWSSMLEDEVATAAPPAGEAVVTPPPPIEYYYPEEESAVVEPERPAVVEPVEPQLAAMAQPPPSPAAGQPPSEALTSAPRIRIGGLLAGVPLTEVAEVPPPGPGLEEVRVRETTRPPPRELTDEEEEIVIKRASRKHRRELYDYGNRLIVYLVTWFVLLITGIVFISPLSAWLETLTFGTASGVPPVIVAPLLSTMLWGGIGGVVGGLYSLWRKIDIFDKQYTVWYTLQPVSGLVLGGIVHVIIMTGFLSMSIQTSGAGGPTVQETQAVQWFPALLAVAFGFRQNNFYALLDRIIRLIGQPREESQQSGAST